MLEPRFYDSLTLSRRYAVGRAIAGLWLAPNYGLGRVRIEMHGHERVPRRDAGESVVLAMNHTDRYNYLPMMYRFLHDRRMPLIAVWVKGKYYRNPVLSAVLRSANTVPLPAIGPTLEEAVRRLTGTPPSPPLYRKLRDVVDGDVAPDDPALGDEAQSVLARELPGPDGRPLPFDDAVRAVFSAAMERAIAATSDAMDRHRFHLLVFPEGTRSVRLGPGRTGLVQFALARGRRIVPIGCSNSDRLYPGDLPVARPGTVSYRFGEPYDPRELVADGELGPYVPFTASARPFRPVFERVTADLMARIEALLDDRHRRPSRP